MNFKRIVLLALLVLGVQITPLAAQTPGRVKQVGTTKTVRVKQTKPDNSDEKAAAEASKQAEKAAAEANKQAEKAAAEANKQAEKAAAEANKQAEKAAAEASKQAEKAAAEASKQAAHAERQTVKAQRQVEKAENKAAYDAMQAQRQMSTNSTKAEKQLAYAAREAEMQAAKEREQAQKNAAVSQARAAADSSKTAKRVVRDSVSSLQYRKILGVQFNKNVDYKTSINYFEDKNNYALLEKGVSFISFNLGLASFKLDNKWIEPIVKIDDTYYTQFSVKASGGYFIANNTAVALKVAYGFYDNRIKVSSDILQLLINAKTYETNNVGTDVNIAAVIRNYIPIGFQQRFFIITETALGYKYSESVQRNIYDEGARISKIQTRSHMAMLGISPGVSYFMTKGFAFEFMLSPIQIYYKNTQSVNDVTQNGQTQSYGLTFAFTPLNIQLGFSYYFGLNYKKNYEYMKRLYNNRGQY